MAADYFVTLFRFDAFSVEKASFILMVYIDVNHSHRTGQAVDSTVFEGNHQVAASRKQRQHRKATEASFLEALTKQKMRQHRFMGANLRSVWLRVRTTATHLHLTVKHRVITTISQHRFGPDVQMALVFQNSCRPSFEKYKIRFLLWQVAIACHDSGHDHMTAEA